MVTIRISWLRFWLVLFLLASNLPGMSPALADSYVEDDFQSWNVVTLTLPLDRSKKVLGYMEVQPRIGDNLRDFSTILIRPALGYKIHPNVSIWQGYGWTPAFIPEFRDEHRIFQQLLANHRLKRLTLTNRTRLEERFIENTGGTAVRGRHMLRLAIPLDKERKWAAVLYDELFVNFNSVADGPQSGFDQNRLFAGVNRTFGRYANMDAGYMANYINRSGTPDRLNHIILLMLNVQVK